MTELLLFVGLSVCAAMLIAIAIVMVAWKNKKRRDERYLGSQAIGLRGTSWGVRESENKES